MRRGLLFVSALAVAAAAGAQTYSAPQGTVADSIPQAWSYDEHFNPASPDDDAWWHNFDDQALDSLIAIGMEHSYDVAAAVRRIAIAERQLEMVRSAYYPNVGVQAGWSRQRSSGAVSSPTVPASTSSYFSLGATMSWEADIFGKIGSKVKEQKASIEVSRAEMAGVHVSLAASIANAYISLRTLPAQLDVANSNIASQKHILHMTEARHRAGLASMLDVTQARVVVYSTKATIPPLEASIKTTANSIMVLTGSFPAENAQVASLLAPRPMPGIFHLVGIGVPADLLRRRPDVIAAEARLAADAAAIGVAKKDFLPSLTIDGSIGTSAHRLDDMMTGRSFNYSIAPRLSWTLFDGFSRRAAVASAREQLQADIDSYNLTLQQAVEEVDNAIITYGGSLSNISMLESTVEQSQKSLDLSVDLYKNSLSAFSNVVDAQMNLLTYQNSLVSARGSALKSLVNIYKSLGGGWSL